MRGPDFAGAAGRAAGASLRGRGSRGAGDSGGDSGGGAGVAARAGTSIGRRRMTTFRFTGGRAGSESLAA